MQYLDKQSGDSSNIEVLILLRLMYKYGTQRGVQTPDTQQEIRSGQGHSYRNLPIS